MCEAHAQAAVNHAGSVSAALLGGREYNVKGMTCDNCALAVTEELEQVPGVTGIDIDVQAGRVVVRGDGFSDEAIGEAVDEAGYELIAS